MPVTPTIVRHLERGIYLADYPRGYYLVVPERIALFRSRIRVLAVHMTAMHAVPVLIRPERLADAKDIDDDLAAQLYRLATAND